LNRVERAEVLDAFKAADLSDRVRADAESIYQAFIEAELTETIGAGLHARSASRSALRNGHRARTLSTIAGTSELQIPKRTGLEKAIAAVPPGASWRRCPVRFLRGALAHVPEGSSEVVAAAIRTTFT
jgi:transposase-like protein